MISDTLGSFSSGISGRRKNATVASNGRCGLARAGAVWGRGSTRVADILVSFPDREGDGFCRQVASVDIERQLCRGGHQLFNEFGPVAAEVDPQFGSAGGHARGSVGGIDRADL